MFLKNYIYNRRRDIHDKYQGQRYGGISTPCNYPYIFLFSTPSGEKYGYKDGWTAEGIYLYTGEGQYGNMEFTKGNKAILEHKLYGKRLFLFEYVFTGHVRFIGEMEYHGYHYANTNDINGRMRRAIVFELKEKTILRSKAK